MSEKIKINMLTVAQYMNVIKDPPTSEAEKALSAQDKAILDKFREAARSYFQYSAANGWDSKAWTIEDSSISPYPISYAWGSLNAILIVFQYLIGGKQDAEEALKLEGLFKSFKHDAKINTPGVKEISGARAQSFIFKIKGNGYIQKTAIFQEELPEEKDFSAYRDNFDKILDSCTKDSAIETVIRCLEPYVRPETLAGFREMARRGFDVDLSISPKKLDGPLWNSCEKLYSAGARQIVFTGAPGTGKTYTAEAFAKYISQKYAAENRTVCDERELGKHIKTVQFHSGYDYSDFVEGLRPAQTGENGEMTFVRLDGQFKAFCRKILEAQDKNAPYFFIIDEINRADLSRVFGELMFCLDESKRPASPEDTAGKTVVTQYSNLPTYQIGESGEAVRLKKAKDVYRDGFFIPGNLCILATMNDIDRSVETFDFALRRRFKWIEADANAEMDSGLLGMLGNKVPEDQIKSLAEKVRAMNNVIFKGENDEGENTEGVNFGGEQLRLTRDYHIGHAYFEKFSGSNLQDIWDTQIEQILREYCRGRSATAKVDTFIQYCKTALGIENNS